MHHRTDLRSILFILFTLAFAGGCASKTQGEKAVQSYMDTRETLETSRKQVAETQASLIMLRMTSAQGLNDGFRHYRDEVSQLEKAGADARRRAAAMKEEAAAHVKAWQEEMETVKDPTIKANLESRREAVRTNFTQIKMYAEDARKAYGPYLQGNKDLVQALSIDLSPASVASLGKSVDRVVADGKVLDERLWKMQRALDNIAMGSPPAGNRQ